MGTGAVKNAPQIARSSDMSAMPAGRAAVSPSPYPSPSGGGFGAIPTNRGGDGSGATGWFVGATVFALAAGYWVYFVGAARYEAIVTRKWSQSTVVQVAVKNAVKTAPASRRQVWKTNVAAITTEFKKIAKNTPGAERLATAPVSPELLNIAQAKLIKSPNTLPAALINAANRREAEAFRLYPALVADEKLHDSAKWGLIGAAILCAGIGGVGLIPKRRPFTAQPSAIAPAPVVSPLAVAPRIGAPRTVAPAPTPTLATPFPPPPELVAPTIQAPSRGTIAATVAAVGSASAEVTRLVKRLEELENLSGQLKSERDESRKELTWTQSALDDFKKRVSDATTMATASAAASAGASEQRAAQAEQRVTEAVEHINEALARAVETEQGVSQAKEIAHTAEERAAHAEERARETQFQLQRAMERLADLERLAAVTRIGGVSGPMGATGFPAPPAALPAPDRTVYPQGFESSPTSPFEDALAAAAKPAEIPVPVAVEAPPASALDSSFHTRPAQRTPPPRLTNTKMSDIEAGLKLARSIRSRTQKSVSTDDDENN